MYGKSSSSSLVFIPNEVRTDLWLSCTSDAETSVRLYVGFPGSELSQSKTSHAHRNQENVRYTFVHVVKLHIHKGTRKM